MQATNLIIYKSENRNISVQVQYEDGTFWLTQKRMAELYGVESNTITYHLQEICKNGELQHEATARKIRVVQKEGNRDVSRNLDFYNLDAIIAVGYRVNSFQATKFRIWATQTLKEYIVKGFVLDDERLKQGKDFGKDYFRELLERVRSIRASERRIWQQITDIYAECSTDYNKNSPTTKDFYAMIQNKFHYAIAGQTATEIIYHNAGICSKCQ
ncbi:MAG: virulence RhuM family protein [Bacteroidales bacterium]|nr:virulence RhuM family protein [Bacteroidales bacterium]